MFSIKFSLKVVCLLPLMEMLIDHTPHVFTPISFDGKAMQTTKFDSFGPTKYDMELPTL
ncbi:hypothetical protein ACB098_09G044800 [Castanea mollissima]